MPKQQPGRTFTIAVTARQDIADIFRYSRREFGPAASLRYDVLIKQALRDIQADPLRSGARQREGLPKDIYLFHLDSSRSRVSGESVKEPRHFVMYRVTDDSIEILRLIHDSRDPALHIPQE